MMKTKHNLTGLIALLLSLALAPDAGAFLFGPKGASKAEKKANIRQQSDEMLTQLYTLNPALKSALKEAAGYATFKQVSVNLLMLATANGYGVVVDNKTKQETFMRMGSLGGGVGAGVKDVRVIFVFYDPKVMKQFVEQGWQLGGQADASAKYQDMGIAGEQGAQVSVNYKDGTIGAGTSTELAAKAGEQGSANASLAVSDGMAVYQFTESGVSLQAIVTGTKYWKDSKLNQ